MDAPYDIDPGPDHEDHAVLKALAALPLRPAPSGLARSFSHRLVREYPNRPTVRWWLMTGLAALLIVVVGAGWWHERRLRLDDAWQMQRQLTSALQNLSTGARLQAIDATVRAGQHGDAVEGALITALLSDPNTNVRMAAAEALGRIARPDVLRKAVRRALALENSPFVQMTLLSAAGRLPVAERRAAITPLLVRADIDPLVSSDARDRVRDPLNGDSR